MNSRKLTNEALETLKERLSAVEKELRLAEGRCNNLRYERNALTTAIHLISTERRDSSS